MKKIFKTLFAIIVAQSSFSQSTYHQIFVSTSNDEIKPISENVNLSSNASFNQLLQTFGVVKYVKAYKYSHRPESVNEFMLYTAHNGDSLVAALKATHYFDTIINFGVSQTSGLCSSPIIVNDPITTVMDNWAINNIDAACAWTITTGDPRIILAFSDTEFDELHEDLLGKYKTVWKLDPAYVGPVEAHGTRVSGIAVASTNNGIGISGVGYNLKAAGYDVTASIVSPLSGIIQAYADHQRIINVSWGETGLTNTQASEMTKHGTVLVVAAGNDPSFTDHKLIADIPGVINVSAINYENKVAPTGTARNKWVDICAPGCSVLRTNPTFDNPSIKYNYSYPNSTSMACAYVTGTIGLMLSVNPCLSPTEIETILKGTASPIADAASYPGLTGAGHLNTALAVSVAQKISCMNIVGIDLNTLCRPGRVSGLTPQFTVKMEGGIPPYTYKWEPITAADNLGAVNSTTLDNYNIANPTVVSSTGTFISGHLAYYRLIVTDAGGPGSPQKMAIRYVKVQLRQLMTPLVAMRDSYWDMLNETNDQKIINEYEIDTWTSPDLWNRQVADNISKHQNPEYFIAAPNYLYTRIKNYGCAASTGTEKLRLYWTKASTGEDWDGDWTTINVKDKYGAVTLPGGREITSGSGISVPALAPGAETILSHAWYVPKPQDYEKSPNSFEACVLGRIETSVTYPFGMTIPEVFGSGIGTNVRNNNKIVTRNLNINNLNNFDLRFWNRYATVGNAETAGTTFNIRFESERPIYPNVDGDYSQYGSVTLHLGDLFDRWMGAGGAGRFTSMNENLKTVTMRGMSLMALDSIPFFAGEKFDVQVDFTIDSGVTLPDSTFQRMYLRQYLTDFPDSLYGSVGYEVRLRPGNLNNRNYNETSGKALSLNDQFFVNPNPTSSVTYLSYRGSESRSTEVAITDMLGRELYKKHIELSAGDTVPLDMKGFIQGVYIVTVRSGQNAYNMKVVKL